MRLVNLIFRRLGLWIVYSRKNRVSRMKNRGEFKTLRRLPSRRPSRPPRPPHDNNQLITHRVCNDKRLCRRVSHSNNLLNRVSNEKNPTRLKLHRWKWEPIWTRCFRRGEIWAPLPCSCPMWDICLHVIKSLVHDIAIIMGSKRGGVWRYSNSWLAPPKFHQLKFPM